GPNNWVDLRQDYLPRTLTEHLVGEPVWASVAHRREQIQNEHLSEELAGYLAEDLKQVLLRLHEPLDWGQLRGRERAQRRTALTLLMSIVCVFLFLSAIATWLAIRARQDYARAESARSNAEQLIDFMLFRLRDKLVPIGRLDLLRDVNESV